MMLEPQNRFTRRATREQGSVRVAFFIFLAIVAVIGWLYVFFISDAFHINDIEVAGAKGIDATFVKREVYDAIDLRPRPFWEPARHTLFLTAAQLEPILTEKLGVEHLMIEKPRLNVLRLIVQERVRRLILHTPTTYFWLDGRGMVLAELTSTEQHDAEARLARKRISTPTDVPIVRYEMLEPIVVDQAIQDPQISRWLAISLQLQKQGIGYLEIQPPGTPSSTRLVVITAQGYEAWFDTSQDTLETQIEAFKAFQQQKPKDLQVKEYVDARIPQRIYVK